MPDPQKIIPHPKSEEQNKLLQEFLKWLDNALPGDKYCYFQGPYLTGSIVGHAAMQAYEHGRLVLFQKRESGSRFTYWAQKALGGLHG